MKHAGDATLDQVEELLIEIREQNGVKEKKRGIFYRSSSAFLHFHEDAAGLFADLRAGSDWERLPVNTPAQKRALLTKVKAALRATRP